MARDIENPVADASRVQMRERIRDECSREEERTTPRQVIREHDQDRGKVAFPKYRARKP
jgi:hypothetical protein